MQQATTVLVDARNWDTLYPQMVEELEREDIHGLDIETHNEKSHDALKSYKKGKIFDPKRPTVTGLSFYVDGSPYQYYINIEHADVANRVPWSKVEELLSHKSPDNPWFIHNAPFEIVMLKNGTGWDVGNFVCTLQMAVTCYNDDTYNVDRFKSEGLGEISRLMPDVAMLFEGWTPGQARDEEQEAIFRKVTAKESDAAHSYNGLVQSVRYGFGLKEAVFSFFGYKMKTFEEVVGDRGHMGNLTGQEVANYGADDAYWCVQLGKRLIEYMAQHGGPDLIKTYFEQELPAVSAYADVWTNGWCVNVEAIGKRTIQEQKDCAQLIRDLKAAIKPYLPFPDAPSDFLKRESWYTKGDAYKRYRQRIVDFCNAPDGNDEVIFNQISGSVPKSVGAPAGSGPNFTHYMMMRTLFHDLLGLKPVYVKGAITTDAEARGRLFERVKADAGLSNAVKQVNMLAGVEQRMKLYLIPYSHLVDPDTGKLYPQLSSMLNTRRLAARFPNPMQLSKRGGSTYVRGFYESDGPDYLVISQDWSQIELVLIGDQSGDPTFREVYGQLPYKDLHVGSAADLLAIEVDGMTEEVFKSLQFMDSAKSKDLHPRLMTNLKGLPIEEPKLAYKYWRNELGKVSNFGYWYSGALSDVAERMGWSSDVMWQAVERYRERFPVAEEWRISKIHQLQQDGFLTLPDHHRRYIYEATPEWANHMKALFGAYNNQAITNFGNSVIKKIQGRAGNQGVNALIQGSCATLAKRSIARIRAMIAERGLRARFLMMVHDEAVWNCHKDDAVEFIREAKKIMVNHPDIVRTLPVDCTSSIGRNFEPFDKVKAPFGQIELDEAPDFLGLPKGEKLNEDQIRLVIDYLTK